MDFISKEQVLEKFHFRAATRFYDPNKKVSREDFDYILELKSFDFTNLFSISCKDHCSHFGYSP